MFLICFFLFNIVSLFAAHTNCATLKGESNALIHSDPQRTIFDHIINNGIGVHTCFDNQDGTWKFDEKKGCSIFLDDKACKPLFFQNGAIVNLRTKKIFFPDVINLSLCCKQLYKAFEKNKLHLETKWLSKRCLLPIESEISFQEAFFDMEIPTLHYLQFEKATENEIFIFDGLKGFVNTHYFEFKPQVKYLMYLFLISKIIFNDSMNFEQIHSNIYPKNQSVFSCEYNSSFYKRDYSFFVTTFILSALCNTYVISMKDDYLLSMIKRYYSNFQILFQENQDLQQKIHFIGKIFDSSKNIEDVFLYIADSCELFFQFLKNKEMQNDKAKKIDMLNNEKKIFYYYFELLKYLSFEDFIFYIPFSEQSKVIKSGLLEIRKSFVWSCLVLIESLFIKKYPDSNDLLIKFFKLVIPSGSDYFYLKMIKPLIFHLIHLSSDVQNVFAFFHYVDLGKLNTELEYFYINGNPIFSEDTQALFIHTIFNDALLKTGLTKESFSKKLTPDQEDNLKVNLVNEVDFSFKGLKMNYSRFASLNNELGSKEQLIYKLQEENKKNLEGINALKKSRKEYKSELDTQSINIKTLIQKNQDFQEKIEVYKGQITNFENQVKNLTQENLELKNKNESNQMILNGGKGIQFIQSDDSDLKNQQTIKKFKKIIIFLFGFSVILIAHCGYLYYSFLKKNYSSV